LLPPTSFFIRNTYFRFRTRRYWYGNQYHHISCVLAGFTCSKISDMGQSLYCHS
jgi:hypothetical protein